MTLYEVIMFATVCYLCTRKMDLSRQRISPTRSIFNSKEAIDFLSLRVLNAQANPSLVAVYQGEQRAWGGTRPFNPIKDDFLQLVEIAVDSYKQSPTTAGTGGHDESTY